MGTKQAFELSLGGGKSRSCCKTIDKGDAPHLLKVRPTRRILPRLAPRGPRFCLQLVGSAGAKFRNGSRKWRTCPGRTFPAPAVLSRYIATEGMGQMAQLALTDRFIAGAKSFEIQTDYFDDNPKTRGLCLRVTNGGRKMWCLLFTSPKGASAPA